MSSNTGQVNIANDGKVSIGPKESTGSELVPLGKTVVTKLNEMISILVSAMNEMEKDVPEFNIAISSGAQQQLLDLNSSTPEILSENVCINESHYSQAVEGMYNRSIGA